MSIQNAWHLHCKKGGEFDQQSFKKRIAIALLIQNKKNPSYQKGHATRTMQQNIDLRYNRMDHLVIT
ncbi:hypothetical protein BDFB_013494 [Asbolus verrucosus]|uniref:Uncharacterized protein n=1 Tax=Asbolus verrucosus TaxID=1661398 RepID=A0A482WCE0_ASBVE|nr:hypothetical protein BDFB_013494 [Asbolus verrucosus]